MNDARMDFLYTDIGRGHPYYLDGIIQCMSPELVGRITDVFKVSSGFAVVVWRLARFLYDRSSSRSGGNSIYTRLRQHNDYNRPGPILKIMGRAIRNNYLEHPDPLVVAHPLLVGILKGKMNLIYQHGEIAAPRESLVVGDHRVLVPVSDTADIFMRAGCRPRKLFVSGLCIEPELVTQAETALESRIKRITGTGPLTGAFFSSGAEPRLHIEKLVTAACSAVSHEGRIIIFARKTGLFAESASRAFSGPNPELSVVESIHQMPSAETSATMCLYESREHLDQLTQGLFSRFDYFAAPSHERTHWALGLGLPMFIVDPPIGTFAPLNRQHLLNYDVAEPVADRGQAVSFGSTLERLRKEGKLEKMAAVCWNRFDIRGFSNIADFLSGTFGV